MRYLRQSTLKVIQVGPFLDATDGVTAKTALTVTVQVSKDGAAFAARNSATAITHDADGFYRVELSATDTDTAGPLVIKSFVATAAPVWHEFAILSQSRYDLAILGSGVQPVNLVQIDGLATTGNNATLNLKQLTVINDAGTAILAMSSGGNGSGLELNGSGSGRGLRATGGTTGNGIEGAGGGLGKGLLCTGGATGHGAEFLGGSSSGSGIQARATTIGSGIYAQGTSNNSGFYGVGSGSGSGMTVESTGSGAGFRAFSSTGHGLHVSGGGASEGLFCAGGATGHGIEAIGGATSGIGLYVHSQSGGGAGLVATGNGGGAGVVATGGGSGSGLVAQAGGGNANGIRAQAAGIGNALDLHADAGYGAGIVSDNAEGVWIVGGTKGLVIETMAGDGIEVILDGSGKALSDTIVDSILTRASIAEPAAVPSYPLSLGSALGWIGALSRNKILQTSTTQSVRNDADSATIATATHTVAGGTHTRGEFS